MKIDKVYIIHFDELSNRKNYLDSEIPNRYGFSNYEYIISTRETDKKILDYILAKLEKISSLKKIIINAYYLADEIEKHLLSLNNPKIILSHEIEKVETGGGLVYALDKIDIDKPLLTLNGDVLWHDKNNFSDINFLSENFDINSHDFLLGLKKTQDYWGYDGGSQSIGDFDLIGKKLHHKTPQKEKKVLMSHVYVGMQILNPKVLLGNHE